MRPSLAHNLLVDELLQLLLAQVVLVLIKVKELLRDRRCSGLIIRVVVGLQVRVLQSLLDCDALDGVKGKQLLQQIQGKFRSLREQCLEGDLLLEGQRTDVLAGTPRLDAIVILHCGSTKNIKNEGQLVVVCNLSV